MPSIKTDGLPLWRIDSGHDASTSRDLAKKADALGNKDGKVTVAEMKAFKAEMKSIYGTKPTPHEMNTDRKRADAWQADYLSDSVIREIESPRSLFHDTLRKHFQGAADSASVLWTIASGKFR